MSLRDITIALRWWKRVTKCGWRHAPEACGGFGGFRWKLRELKTRTPNEEIRVFGGSLRARRICAPCLPHKIGAKWIRRHSEIVSSPPYVETFNSKLIKTFRTWTRSRYVFFEFRDSYVLYMFYRYEHYMSYFAHDVNCGYVTLQPVENFTKNYFKKEENRKSHGEEGWKKCTQHMIYIYIYIYMCVCVCTCAHARVYIYIYRYREMRESVCERERERDRDRERQRELRKRWKIYWHFFCEFPSHFLNNFSKFWTGCSYWNAPIERVLSISLFFVFLLCFHAFFLFLFFFILVLFVI